MRSLIAVVPSGAAAIVLGGMIDMGKNRTSKFEVIGCADSQRDGIMLVRTLIEGDSDFTLFRPMDMVEVIEVAAFRGESWKLFNDGR